MAKVKEELIRRDIAVSGGEIRKQLLKMMERAKSPSAREALQKMMNALEAAPNASMKKVLDIDAVILKTLTQYFTEYMSKENADIDAGVCAIVQEMLHKRGIMCYSDVSDDRRTAFKKFKKKYVSLTRKERKAKFAEHMSTQDTYAKNYEKGMTLLGSMVSSYQLTAMESAKLAEIEKLKEKRKELQKRYQSTSDPAERQRISAENNTYKEKQEALNQTLMRILTAKKKVSDLDSLRTQYADVGAISDQTEYDAEEMESLVDKLAKVDKEELKENKRHREGMDKRVQGRDSYMQGSAEFFGEDTVQSDIERDRMKHLDGVHSDGKAEDSEEAMFGDLSES